MTSQPNINHGAVEEPFPPAAPKKHQQGRTHVHGQECQNTHREGKGRACFEGSARLHVSLTSPLEPCSDQFVLAP